MNIWQWNRMRSRTFTLSMGPATWTVTVSIMHQMEKLCCVLSRCDNIRFLHHGLQNSTHLRSCYTKQSVSYTHRTARLVFQLKKIYTTEQGFWITRHSRTSVSSAVWWETWLLFVACIPTRAELCRTTAEYLYLDFKCVECELLVSITEVVQEFVINPILTKCIVCHEPTSCSKFLNGSGHCKG